MGFFSFLESRDRKIRYAYSQLREDKAGQIFPGGIGQAERVFSSLSFLLSKDIDNENKNFCVKLLNLYIGTALRLEMPMSHESVVSGIRRANPGLVMTDEVIERIIAYTQLSTINLEYVLISSADMVLVDGLVKSNSEMREEYVLTKLLRLVQLC